MIYLFSIIALIMPAFFIERRQRVDDKQTLLLKCLSTFLVVFLSLINYYTYKTEVLWFAMTISGLTLCLVGDFLLGYCHLLGKGHKAYNICRAFGMLIFMLAHIVFIINYAIHLDNFVWQYIFIPIGLALVLFAFAPLAGFKWPHKALIAISLLYLLTICIMLFFGIYSAAEILILGGTANLVHGSFIIVASMLFFASDMMLSFMYFAGRKGKALSIANLTTYYLSLILLALAF